MKNLCTKDECVYIHTIPGVPKKRSEVSWNIEKKFRNQRFSIHPSYMLDILT